MASGGDGAGAADAAFLLRMAAIERSFASLRTQFSSSGSAPAGSGDGGGAVGGGQGSSHRALGGSADSALVAGRCGSRRIAGRPRSPDDASSLNQYRAGSPATSSRNLGMPMSARPLAFGFGLFGGDKDPLQVKRHESPSPTSAPPSSGGDSGRRPTRAATAMPSIGAAISSSSSASPGNSCDSPVPEFASMRNGSMRASSLPTEGVSSALGNGGEGEHRNYRVASFTGGGGSECLLPPSPAHTSGSRPPLPQPPSPPSASTSDDSSKRRPLQADGRAEFQRRDASFMGSGVSATKPLAMGAVRAASPSMPPMGSLSNRVGTVSAPTMPLTEEEQALLSKSNDVLNIYKSFIKTLSEAADQTMRSRDFVLALKRTAKEAAEFEALTELDSSGARIGSRAGTQGARSLRQFLDKAGRSITSLMGLLEPAHQGDERELKEAKEHIQKFVHDVRGLKENVDMLEEMLSESKANQAIMDTPASTPQTSQPVGSRSVPASDDARYKIRLMSSHHGQPWGWYLDAHRAVYSDERSESSTYALVHKTGHPDSGGEWVIEQGSIHGRYKLRLASSHRGQPSGWYLDAHREIGRDRRSGCTSYAIVHRPDASGLVGEWAFEQGSAGDRYKIKFITNHHGQPAGWYLDAYRAETSDERAEDSTYAVVNGECHRDWTVEWELEPIGDAGAHDALQTRQASLTGTWKGDEDSKIEVSFGTNGELLLETTAGDEKIRGTLIPDGDWFEAALKFEDGVEHSMMGIRLEDSKIISRCKWPGEEWEDFLTFEKVAATSQTQSVAGAESAPTTASGAVVPPHAQDPSRATVGSSSDDSKSPASPASSRKSTTIAIPSRKSPTIAIPSPSASDSKSPTVKSPTASEGKSPIMKSPTSSDTKSPIGSGRPPVAPGGRETPPPGPPKRAHSRDNWGGQPGRSQSSSPLSRSQPATPAQRSRSSSPLRRTSTPTPPQNQLPTNWGSSTAFSRRSPDRAEGWLEPMFGASADAQPGSPKPEFGSPTKANGLIGTWWNDQLQFQVSRGASGELLLEIDSLKSRGTLVQGGDWFQSSLKDDAGIEVFVLRIRLDDAQIISRVKFPAEGWTDFLLFEKADSLFPVAAEVSPSVQQEAMPVKKSPAKTSRAASPVGDSLGRMLTGLEPLLEQLLREEDAPQEKGGTVGGGPEATPEKAGNLNADMRTAVVSTLCQMAKTVRELAASVEDLKDENKTLRTECESLRRDGSTQAPRPRAFSESVSRPSTESGSALSTQEGSCVAELLTQAEPGAGADAKAAGLRHMRNLSAPTSEPGPSASAAPPAWPCPAGWTVRGLSPSRSAGALAPGGSASGAAGSSAAPEPHKRLGRSPAKEEAEAGTRNAKQASITDSASTPTASARMATLNDDLGKALLKLARSPDETRENSVEE